jgi:hypothetical protein
MLVRKLLALAVNLAGLLGDVKKKYLRDVASRIGRLLSSTRSAAAIPGRSPFAFNIGEPNAEVATFARIGAHH